MSKGRGIGFFEAGNFHPDFILWLIHDGKQYATFADPKGLLNLGGENDPKIQFYRTVKDIERDLNDDDLILNSFILSITKYGDLRLSDRTRSIEDYEAFNVLFMQDRPTTYIGSMINKILAG